MKNIDEIKSKKTIQELLEFGIINIDKPSGPTSFNVSDFVRKILKIRKTSHFGTLDPKVTGVLPIALNRACKLTGFFIGHDKTYVGIMRIHDDISLEEIQNKINEKFLGKITQLPPVRSRVKRAEREREVKKFELLEKEEKEILFLTEVEGGTYIRKLISDLGDEIKKLPKICASQSQQVKEPCANFFATQTGNFYLFNLATQQSTENSSKLKIKIGAHMLELRRIRAGIFSEDDKKYPSVKLYELENAIQEFENGNEEPLRKIIIPGEIISEIYQVVEVKKEEIKKLFNGKPLFKKDVDKKFSDLEIGKKICIFSNDILIGIYRISKEKEIFARPEFVLQPIKRT